MRNKTIAALAATALGSLSGDALGDVFRLTDGSELVGELTGSTSVSLVISTLDGACTLDRSAIQKHEERLTIERTLDRLATEAGTDGKRWLAIARLAAAKGLFNRALDAADEAAKHLQGFEPPDELLGLPIGGVPRNAALRPQDVTALLDLQGSTDRTARRELARRRLADRLIATGGKTPAPIVASLRAGIDDDDSAIRAASLAAIGHAHVTDLANSVADVMLFDPSAQARQAAIAAAQLLGSQRISARLCSALEKGNAKLRAAALDALEALQDTRAVASLVRALDAGGSGYAGVRANVSFTNQVAYVFDFDTEIAQGAAIANPEVRVIQEGAVLDATVLGVSARGNSEERARIARLLARLTSQDFGNNSKAWNSWLAAKRSPK